MTMMDTVAGWVELFTLFPPPPLELTLLPPPVEDELESPESSMTAMGGD